MVDEMMPFKLLAPSVIRQTASDLRARCVPAPVRASARHFVRATGSIIGATLRTSTQRLSASGSHAPIDVCARQ